MGSPIIRKIQWTNKFLCRLIRARPKFKKKLNLNYLKIEQLKIVFFFLNILKTGQEKDWKNVILFFPRFLQLEKN